MVDRYDASGATEGEYQPGSENKVLLNKLGIIDPEEMDDIELQLLEQLYENVMNSVSVDQIITVSELCEWHRKWLGNLYEWAGKVRSVNMSKGDFSFAAAQQIPRLLAELDKTYLRVYTPCDEFNDDALVEALSIIHVEFILIHPFREGNGRLARLLANVMALQAGKSEIDFGFWDQNKDAYFASIHAGLGGNYQPMEELFRQVLLDSQKESDS